MAVVEQLTSAAVDELPAMVDGLVVALLTELEAVKLDDGVLGTEKLSKLFRSRCALHRNVRYSWQA